MREARVKLKDILTLLRRLRQTLEKEKKKETVCKWNIYKIFTYSVVLSHMLSLPRHTHTHTHTHL